MSKVNTLARTKTREDQYVRITVSVPANVNMFLKNRIPKRQISQFVSAAIAEKLPVYIAQNSKSPLRDLIEFRKKIKHYMTTEEILASINKGRG